MTLEHAAQSKKSPTGYTDRQRLSPILPVEEAAESTQTASDWPDVPVVACVAAGWRRPRDRTRSGPQTVRGRSDPVGQYQGLDDDEDQANTATGVVAPICAVGPSRAGPITMSMRTISRIPPMLMGCSNGRCRATVAACPNWQLTKRWLRAVSCRRTTLGPS